MTTLGILAAARGSIAILCRSIRALILFIALAFTVVANAGPFEDGLAAYDNGQIETAFKTWLVLAEQGHVAAQFNIAVMYENGSGIAKNPSEAARWYLAAAKQGDADSQFKIGMLYEAGVGLAKDDAEARKWYNALIANPRADKAALVAKQRARERLAQLVAATQEVIAYRGGRFVLVRSREGSCVIALQGMISDDTTWKFSDVIARSEKLGCDKPWLMLESPGGLLLPGLRLGREVRSHAFRTVTRYDCASACSAIFLGGVERVLAGSRARIGLHQPALVNDNTHERKCETAMDSPDRRDVRRYLAFVIPATSNQVVDIMMHTSCNDIEWVSGQRALDLGITTSLESTDADLFGPKEDRK